MRAFQYQDLPSGRILMSIGKEPVVLYSNGVVDIGPRQDIWIRQGRHRLVYGPLEATCDYQDGIRATNSHVQDETEAVASQIVDCMELTNFTFTEGVPARVPRDELLERLYEFDKEGGASQIFSPFAKPSRRVFHPLYQQYKRGIQIWADWTRSSSMQSDARPRQKPFNFPYVNPQEVSRTKQCSTKQFTPTLYPYPQNLMHGYSLQVTHLPDQMYFGETSFGRRHGFGVLFDAMGKVAAGRFQNDNLVMDESVLSLGSGCVQTPQGRVTPQAVCVGQICITEDRICAPDDALHVFLDTNIQDAPRVPLAPQPSLESVRHRLTEANDSGEESQGDIAGRIGPGARDIVAVRVDMYDQVSYAEIERKNRPENLEKYKQRAKTRLNARDPSSDLVDILSGKVAHELRESRGNPPVQRLPQTVLNVHSWTGGLFKFYAPRVVETEQHSLSFEAYLQGQLPAHRKDKKTHSTYTYNFEHSEYLRTVLNASLDFSCPFRRLVFSNSNQNLTGIRIMHPNRLTIKRQPEWPHPLPIKGFKDDAQDVSEKLQRSTHAQVCDLLKEKVAISPDTQVEFGALQQQGIAKPLFKLTSDGTVIVQDFNPLTLGKTRKTFRSLYSKAECVDANGACFYRAELFMLEAKIQPVRSQGAKPGTYAGLFPWSPVQSLQGQLRYMDAFCYTEIISSQLSYLEATQTFKGVKTVTKIQPAHKKDTHTLGDPEYDENKGLFRELIAQILELRIRLVGHQMPSDALEKMVITLTNNVVVNQTCDGLPTVSVGAVELLIESLQHQKHLG